MIKPAVNSVGFCFAPGHFNLYTDGDNIFALVVFISGVLMKKLTLLSAFLSVFYCVSTLSADKQETKTEGVRSKNYFKLAAAGFFSAYCFDSAKTSFQGAVDSYTYNTFRYCDEQEHSSHGTVHGYNWINDRNTYCGPLYGKNSRAPINSIPSDLAWSGVAGLAGCAVVVSCVTQKN